MSTLPLEHGKMKDYLFSLHVYKFSGASLFVWYLQYAFFEYAFTPENLFELMVWLEY